MFLSLLPSRTHWVWSQINFLVVHRNLPWPLSRDGHLQGSVMSHATTASPKPSFKAPWRLGGAMVGRGNTGWAIAYQRMDTPAHARTAHSGLLQKRLEEDLVSTESSLMSHRRFNGSRDRNELNFSSITVCSLRFRLPFFLCTHYSCEIRNGRFQRLFRILTRKV